MADETQAALRRRAGRARPLAAGTVGAPARSARTTSTSPTAAGRRFSAARRSSSIGARSWLWKGANGSGKTTLAKIAAGLLQPASGTVAREGRATYLSQDPGRHLVRETALDEVALGVNGDEVRAAAALERFGLSFATCRHPTGSLERGAGAARDRGDLRLRARPARARRADARNRPGPEGGARGVAARAGRSAAAASSSPRTIRSCPLTDAFGSGDRWRSPLRSRFALVAFVGLGVAGLAVGSRRSGARWPRDPARGVRSRRGRVRVARAGR